MVSMTIDNDFVVLYDGTVNDFDEGILVGASLHRDEKVPRLVITVRCSDGAFCLTNQLRLTAADTAALAKALDIPLGQLLKTIQSRVGDQAIDAVELVRQMCDEHGIPWLRRVGDWREETIGIMEQQTSDPPPLMS